MSTYRPIRTIFDEYQVTLIVRIRAIRVLADGCTVVLGPCDIYRRRVETIPRTAHDIYVSKHTVARVFQPEVIYWRCNVP